MNDKVDYPSPDDSSASYKEINFEKIKHYVDVP